MATTDKERVEALRLIAETIEVGSKNHVGGVLEMDNGEVRAELHACGTTHCAAGWFLVGALEDDGPVSDRTKLAAAVAAVKFRYIGEDPKTTEEDPREWLLQNAAYDLDYTDGAACINALFGSELALWADKNPEIWGNAEGCEVFHQATAYLPVLEEDLTLSDIIQHFRDVADRLEATIK